MDTTETITHLGLCAGYGGIELGLKRVLQSLRTVALCEIEAFACANLVAKMEAGLMDPAPIWTDLKTFPWAEFCDRVDILTGGYPCQPFSAAGKRAGKDDPRHLWPWIADGIAAMRPRVCFFENVEGHINLGLRDVIADLESLGYQTTWGIFSASECGAPHQRKRVFVLAHCKDERLSVLSTKRWEIENRAKWSKVWNQPIRQGAASGEKLSLASGFRSEAGLSGSLTRHEGESGVVDYCGDQAWPSRPGQPQHAWEPPRVLVNPNSDRRECNVPRDASQQDSNGQDNGVSCEADSVGNADGAGSQERTRERGTGIQRADANGRTNSERQTEPALGGNTDGSAGGMDNAELSVSCDNRTDELRLLGNGVVPATAELAFRTLLTQL